MQERQVTIGKETFRVDEPFLVLATQNPIEADGTYRFRKRRSIASCSKSLSGIRRRTRRWDR